mmetsp:Transcript_60086/g.186415  ORF Transcript_60086/g.186415 Transcript_60086/m.186415 type:complete len:268 (+) Transcript_60086:674-1477(+)
MHARGLTSTATTSDAPHRAACSAPMPLPVQRSRTREPAAQEPAQPPSPRQRQSSRESVPMAMTGSPAGPRVSLGQSVASRRPRKGKSCTAPTQRPSRTSSSRPCLRRTSITAGASAVSAVCSGTPAPTQKSRAKTSWAAVNAGASAGASRRRRCSSGPVAPAAQPNLRSSSGSKAPTTPKACLRAWRSPPPAAPPLPGAKLTSPRERSTALPETKASESLERSACSQAASASLPRPVRWRAWPRFSHAAAAAAGASPSLPPSWMHLR